MQNANLWLKYEEIVNLSCTFLISLRVLSVTSFNGVSTANVSTINGPNVAESPSDGHQAHVSYKDIIAKINH